MSTRLTPSESFPENLIPLDAPEVEVLNSKLEREITHEVVHDGEPDPETKFRHEEVIEELDRRDAGERGVPTASLLHSVDLPTEATRGS